jgi:hypothetical protein
MLRCIEAIYVLFSKGFGMKADGMVAENAWLQQA